ncbi:MAG: Nif3-like dinuclear metal center hexameric protein [Ruminococcaceae bacterium]|nr:Nif3-like dinuclear metal center hexameric protein [Oscillospiraceae bacterium]
MTAEKIFDFLNEKFPVDSAVDYDNVGFLIGDKTADVKSAVLALDCTDDVIDHAISTCSQLIITHHPVIFDKITNITKDDIIYRLIKNNIAVISMHTNLDVGKDGVCDALANTLCLENIKTVTASDNFPLRIGTLKEEMNSDDFAAYVGRKLDTAVKYVGETMVKTVAVCSGSGSEYSKDAIKFGCDALVTSEVKHHHFISAEHQNFTLIDAGHFPTEAVILEPLSNILTEKFKDINFSVDYNSAIKVCINI